MSSGIGLLAVSAKLQPPAAKLPVSKLPSNNELFNEEIDRNTPTQPPVPADR